MKILNLYAGIGGNRKLWTNCEITAVELREDIAEVYKSNFPNDEMVIGDAHEYLLNHYKKYDFVWSSPPCQKHTKMNKFTRHNMIRYMDGKLYEEIIFLKTYFSGKWVVENVIPYYEPMCNPVKIGRHLFWSNFLISQFKEPKKPKNFINEATISGKKLMMNWIGIHYEKNIYYEGNHCPAQILRNCVHPETGLHILRQAMRNFENNKIIQQELFN